MNAQEKQEHLNKLATNYVNALATLEEAGVARYGDIAPPLQVESMEEWEMHEYRVTTVDDFKKAEYALNAFIPCDKVWFRAMVDEVGIYDETGIATLDGTIFTHPWSDEMPQQQWDRD